MKLGPKKREFLARVERSKGKLMTIQINGSSLTIARQLLRLGYITTGTDDTLRGSPETLVITDAGKEALAASTSARQ